MLMGAGWVSLVPLSEEWEKERLATAMMIVLGDDVWWLGDQKGHWTSCPSKWELAEFSPCARQPEGLKGLLVLSLL